MAADTAVQDQDVLVAAVRLGRPRDEKRDVAILTAALDLVAEVGYDRVSMDAVAARARVSKATIYRRWDSKGAVVAAAVRCRSTACLQMPDTGSLRDDLLAAVSVMGKAVGEQDLALMTGIFAAMRRDPELAEALRCDLFAEKHSLTEGIFTRAEHRGDAVTANANALFHEVAPAVLMHRLAALDLPLDAAFFTHLVDDVLLPILTSHTPSTPGRTYA